MHISEGIGRLAALLAVAGAVAAQSFITRDAVSDTASAEAHRPAHVAAESVAPDSDRQRRLTNLVGDEAVVPARLSW